MSDEYLGDPWTIRTEMHMRQHPQVQMISLLTDEAGAALIAKGIVPAYVKQQCREALEWCCTEDRAAPSERSLFETGDTGDGS